MAVFSAVLCGLCFLPLRLRPAMAVLLRPCAAILCRYLVGDFCRRFPGGFFCVLFLNILLSSCSLRLSTRFLHGSCLLRFARFICSNGIPAVLLKHRIYELCFAHGRSTFHIASLCNIVEILQLQ